MALAAVALFFISPNSFWKVVLSFTAGWLSSKWLPVDARSPSEELFWSRSSSHNKIKTNRRRTPKAVEGGESKDQGLGETERADIEKTEMFQNNTSYLGEIPLTHCSLASRFSPVGTRGNFLVNFYIYIKIFHNFRP